MIKERRSNSKSSSNSGKSFDKENKHDLKVQNGSNDVPFENRVKLDLKLTQKQSSEDKVKNTKTKKGKKKIKSEKKKRMNRKINEYN